MTSPSPTTSEQKKMDVALGYGCSQKFGSPFNIFVMAEASKFTIGLHVGFEKKS